MGEELELYKISDIGNWATLRRERGQTTNKKLVQISISFREFSGGFSSFPISFKLGEIIIA